MKPFGVKVVPETIRKLRGGSQSFLPFAPARGMTFTSLSKGLTSYKQRNYITPRQNPLFRGLKNFGGGFR